MTGAGNAIPDQALRGSSWLGEIRKRRATISDDFSELRMELGTALAELNVTEDGFMWAHQVLAQFAVHFVVDDGSILTALVPGAEVSSRTSSVCQSHSSCSVCDLHQSNRAALCCTETLWEVNEVFGVSVPVCLSVVTVP